MDGLSLKTIADIVSSLGLGGLVLILSWLYQRQVDRILRETAERHQQLLDQYQQHFEAVKRMYENNAELLKRHIRLSEDMKDVLIMNTQAFTALEKAVSSNQFCPLVRTRKEISIRSAGGQVERL